MRKEGRMKEGEDVSPREKKIQEIKKKLIEEKAVLLAEASTALSSLSDEVGSPEMGDQASAEVDRSLMLRLKERERQLLKKIDQAVERINSGTYGACEACGEEIEIKRLEARPVTILCIECKTAQEEEEKLR